MRTRLETIHTGRQVLYLTYEGNNFREAVDAALARHGLDHRTHVQAFREGSRMARRVFSTEGGVPSKVFRKKRQADLFREGE